MNPFAAAMRFFKAAISGVQSAMLSDEGHPLFQPAGPRYFHWLKQGYIYNLKTSAAGVIAPIFSATGQVFGLWNPPNSGVNLIPIALAMTYVSTTGAAGGYTIGIKKNVAQLIGTAGPISAFTEATPEHGLWGSAVGGGQCKGLVATTTVTGGCDDQWHMGTMNQLVTTAATTGIATFSNYYEFNGQLGVKPGNAIFLCGNIANLAVFVPQLTYAEVPTNGPQA